MSKTTSISHLFMLYRDDSCGGFEGLGKWGYIESVTVSDHGYHSSGGKLGRLYGLRLRYAVTMEPFFWPNGNRDVSCEHFRRGSFEFMTTMDFSSAVGVMTQLLWRNLSVGVNSGEPEILLDGVSGPVNPSSLKKMRDRIARIAQQFEQGVGFQPDRLGQKMLQSGFQL